MRGWLWMGLVLCCLPSWAQPAAPATLDQAWRDRDRAFAAQVWTDQGVAVAAARERAEAAARAGHLAAELQARAEYLSQVAPLAEADLAAAERALARAQAAGEQAIAFDLLCALGFHHVLTHTVAEARLEEIAALANRLGDPGRKAILGQVQAMAASYAGRTADAARLLTEALNDAPNEFRRVELLLTRADTAFGNQDSKAAVESARADLAAAFELLDPERYRTFGFQGNAARARLERTAGHVEGAIQALKEAVRLVPPSMAGSREHTLSTLELAHTLVGARRYGEARVALRSIQRTDNLGPADRLSLATIQALVTSELEGSNGVVESNAWLARAAEQLDRLKDDPRMVVGYHMAAARVYERTGQQDKALSAWKDAFKAAREQSTRANEKMRLELQTKLDIAAKERENAALRASADLESERRLRWSWAFAISAVAAALLAAAWASTIRQKRRLAQLRDELATRNAQLEERSSSRIRMLAAACHDLRQPAHALGMLAELGADAIREPEASRTWLHSIKRCSSTLSEMLGELMDLSRLDGGHYEPLMDAVSLDELLHDVRLPYADVAQRKGLVFDAPPCGLTVLSDRQLLRRMVFNGVANAVKYTRSGRVNVSAGVEDGVVTLVVADTGPGIPPDKLDQVFQDHVRLDPRQAVDGLGIGLSIVRRAAQLLGHSAALDSVVGQGTRFTLTLGVPVEAAVSEGSDMTDTGPVGEGTLIALIENDPAIRDAMAAVLRRWRFTVAAADSVDAVLDAANGKAPDLVITDLHLDHADGLDAVVSLRNRTGRPGLPALLVTGDLDASVAERATALQVQLTHKPLPPLRLLAAVTLALHQAAGVTGEPATAQAPSAA
jgi:signal transduction histidine kinase